MESGGKWLILCWCSRSKKPEESPPSCYVLCFMSALEKHQFSCYFPRLPTRVFIKEKVHVRNQTTGCVNNANLIVQFAAQILFFLSGCHIFYLFFFFFKTWLISDSSGKQQWVWTDYRGTKHFIQQRKQCAVVCKRKGRPMEINLHSFIIKKSWRSVKASKYISRWWRGWGEREPHSYVWKQWLPRLYGGVYVLSDCGFWRSDCL